MKQTDFAVLLTSFLTNYLSSQRNVSSNTIKSYRDTFVIFLRYCHENRKWHLNQIQMKDINDALVIDFMKFLEEERHCCLRTQKQRLTVLHAFSRYAQIEAPELFLQCQRIQMVCCPSPKSSPVRYLSVEEIKEILAQPDLKTSSGRRDTVLLSLLYDSGARVQELIDLKVRDFHLDSPAHVRIHGKGRKIRIVPLMAVTVKIIRQYLEEHSLCDPAQSDRPLFSNRFGQKFSRSGIRYILLKYVDQTNIDHQEKRNSISPHTLRHTKAMHLLLAKTPLPVIRDFLGHENINTTGIYVRANLEMKREALEKVYETTGLPSPLKYSWQQDDNLLDWLKNL